jgi:Carbohydrate-selective porin, OprB family/S-layer homology domain
MSKTLWNAIRLSPAVLGAAILAANGALAADPLDNNINPEETAIALSSEAPAQNGQVIAGTPAVEINAPVDNSTKLAQVSTPEAPQQTGTLEQINDYSQSVTPANPNTMGQVTSVSQLSDVDPTHWAFQALQSLVERYGCIEGYPDRTYRGNRALTRYEFAAGLNSCLDRIQELIAAAVADLPSKEDIATIRRLQEEFAAELATLRGRVDALEARTARLEAQQFSTTTKLRGEAIFAVAGVFGEERAVPSRGRQGSAGDIDDNVIFADRVRLNFDTSFSGKDRLRTRLQARNVTSFGTAVTGTNMTRLGFDGNEENDVFLSRLEYRFPLGPRTNVFLVATGAEYNDNMYTFNPLLDSSGQGAISRFGRFNPIYRQGEGGAGLTLDHSFGSALGISLGYLVPGNIANNPNEGFGLIDGNYAALAQLSIRPSRAFNVGLTYVRSYSNNEGGVNLTGGTGSAFAAAPFGRVATTANHYGVQASFRFGPGFTLGGWAGLTDAEAEAGAFRGANAQSFNWAANLAFADFGKKGNLLGFIVGQPPKVTDSDLDGGLFRNDAGNLVQTANREDDGTTLHVEGLYRIQVSDSISITPGVIWLMNPEHNDDNKNIFVGTIRTTFSF